VLQGIGTKELCKKEASIFLLTGMIQPGLKAMLQKRAQNLLNG
jgi:hypothetical protein